MEEVNQMMVSEVNGDSIIVTSEDSITFGFTWQEEWGPVPSIGTKFLVEGPFGRPVTGVFREDGTVLLGREYFERKSQALLDKWAQEKRDNLEKNRQFFMDSVASLDSPFKERMERFIDEAGGFDEFFGDMGDYELFIVMQASALYDVYMTCGQPHYDFWNKSQKDQHANKWFDGFQSMSWTQQSRVFPDLDGGHSGNTHDGMISLARAVALGNKI